MGRKRVGPGQVNDVGEGPVGGIVIDDDRQRFILPSRNLNCVRAVRQDADRRR